MWEIGESSLVGCPLSFALGYADSFSFLGLLAVGFEIYGNDDELERDGIDHLYNVYVKINEASRAERKAGKKSPSQVPPDESSIDERAKDYFAKMENREHLLALLFSILD